MGIQTTAYPPITDLSEYGGDYGPEALPRSRDIAERHCALPLSSVMSEADVDTVVSAVAGLVEDQPGRTDAERPAAVN